MPGFGDSATWPAIGNHGDPRNDDEPADEVEQAQDLMGEIREQIDRAEKAVFSREWETYRIAILNAHDLAGSLWS
jgi:hypothetical protein